MNQLSSPAALRNRDPIAGIVADVLPRSGLVLEIASGTGEHVAHFARRFAHLNFQPSDPDADARASIAAYAAGEALPNLRPPLELDAAAAEWPITLADAVLAINMVHISPWAATEGLIAGAARILTPGGLLYLYGPYRREGVPTAPSNEAFDDSLKARNPAWGLRSLEVVAALAASNALVLKTVIEMPANNLSLILYRA